MERISPREALALMERDGYAYLDVRTVPEFETGHPTGAYNVPVALAGEGGMVPNARFADEVAAVFAKDAPLVVGCASGVRSLDAALQLEAAGFTRVVEQRAGMVGVRDPFGRVRERGWRDEGLPVATTAESARAYREIAARLEGGREGGGRDG